MHKYTNHIIYSKRSKVGKGGWTASLLVWFV